MDVAEGEVENNQLKVKVQEQDVAYVAILDYKPVTVTFDRGDAPETVVVPENVNVDFNKPLALKVPEGAPTEKTFAGWWYGEVQYTGADGTSVDYKTITDPDYLRRKAAISGARTTAADVDAAESERTWTQRLQDAENGFFFGFDSFFVVFADFSSFSYQFRNKCVKISKIERNNFVLFVECSKSGDNILCVHIISLTTIKWRHHVGCEVQRLLAK